eukprot:CAMPEP_0202891162 /NCGR_PEP_ID=MMETSP1392-20130828/1301_1 /ASSEMBLY_ACC=CAM_ASM_000868 /TAXON_ID=225041 /ORGANISM="Chlamydomonas chlamydogama, Strain SAG 11-48b" /LENGTH=259 /DNA_ID=CAMNT_0049574843 /DNA_START=36 /DNA_END=815 /DNA_ORIENTATION=+
MEAKSILLETIVPALGALISTVMYAVPIKAVTRASQNRTLGDLNPIPFSVTVANTIIWLSYGLLRLDPFITTPNCLGVVMAIYCTVTTYGLADEKVRSRVRMVLCAEAVLLPVLWVVSAFAFSDVKDQQNLWGLAGNTISLIYYGAPLSSMAEVIRTRNSASILLPLTMVNLTNALLWTAYGLAVMDAYVWLPNGIGAALSLAQLALSMMFPARHGSAVGSHVSSALDHNHDALPSGLDDLRHVADEERVPLKRPDEKH